MAGPVDTEWRRLIEEHSAPLYQWIGRIVTLASGALTLLIGLKQHYVTQSTAHLWLLAVCWNALALAILLGVGFLYWESKRFTHAANLLARTRYEEGIEAALQRVKNPAPIEVPLFFRFCLKATVIAFLVAVVCISLFATLNLSPPATPANTATVLPPKP